MPSPIGHALGAVAAAWAASSGTARRPARAAWRAAALFALAGLLADLDLAVGLHSQYTHSLGAVVVVFGVAWLATGARNLRMAAAIAAAYASHPLLDWLGQDGTPPYGIMLLWPLDHGYYSSGLELFTGISRRYRLPGFVAHNAAAVAREVAILGPLALAAWWLGPRRSVRASAGASCVAENARPEPGSESQRNL